MPQLSSGRRPAYNNAGFSLVEIMLAVSLFALLAGIFAGALIYAEQTAAVAGRRTRAVQLAEEGMEAVRNIRDQNFNNLADGTWGLSLSSGHWALAANPDVTGIFTRRIDIAADPNSASTKDILITITWPQDLQRNGQITLGTELTDWRGD